MVFGPKLRSYTMSKMKAAQIGVRVEIGSLSSGTSPNLGEDKSAFALRLAVFAIAT